MCRYVAYYRVSTSKQGQSGLGLEAQRQAVSSFLSSYPDSEVIAEFQDIESGKHDDRPQLQEAFKLCRATKAVLLIAKLDRLSRNAAFLLNLQNSQIAFKCCDMPEADSFMIGIMAVLAEKERKMISERTKAALQAAKARGVKLGGYREGSCVGLNPQGIKAVKAKADQHAKTVAFYVREAQGEGLSLRKIADRLNGQGILTSRGGSWTACSVRNVIARLDKLSL